MVNCPIAFLGCCPDIHCVPCLRKELETMSKQKNFTLNEDEARLIVRSLIGLVKDYTDEIRRYDYILERMPGDNSTLQLKANAEHQRELTRALLEKFER